MWEILIELAKVALKKVLKAPKPKKILRGFKTKLTSPFKFAKDVFKNPKTVIAKRFSKPARRARSKYKKAQRLGRLTRFALSPKSRAMEETTKNALLMNSINEEINLKLSKRTNAERSTSEIVEEIAQGRKVLNQLKLEEIRQINESIKKELSGIGLDSQTKIASIIESEEFKEEIVNTASYEHFMDNWKDKFFAYKPEELGMSEDERQEVWEQIALDNTYQKFAETKA